VTATSVSYPMGKGDTYSVLKRLGREDDYSPPSSSADFKNAWSYASTPHYVFMAQCLSTQWIRFHGLIFSHAQVKLYLYLIIIVIIIIIIIIIINHNRNYLYFCCY
jgi:hypothetical protein